MIVCVCNNVSEKKIQSAVAMGASTMADLREQLEVGTCCGKCASCARKVMRDCLNDRAEQASGFQNFVQQLHFQPAPMAA
ncbi:(2Fe-2S)-binding protein [Undibacterium sp. TS12]|uniref:(2Fe-2S)-binding protein n=1 Tax=Undibacterium sp. TS12 TaxID=2908202 RepID=UPI001F4C6E47|nr:(2Fe-2S)-binding protein [Undibacterium sp. TS12]MCH8620056.1 (2Fe-2S)-binding protein [Undibacterium sp. TS12]